MNTVGKTNHISYVRVYRQVSETKAFRRHGKIYEEFQEQECDEAPGVRFVMANVVKWSLSNVLGRVVSVFANDPIPTAEEVEEPAVEEEPEHTPAASEEYTDADAGYIDEDEGFTPQTIPLADQLAMSNFLEELKKHNATNSYRMPDQSLEAHVFRLAYKEGRTVMASFPKEDEPRRRPSCSIHARCYQPIVPEFNIRLEEITALTSYRSQMLLYNSIISTYDTLQGLRTVDSFHGEESGIVIFDVTGSNKFSFFTDAN
ncbi:hypothetical protein ASPVEDRAFT_855434 [Aspergillus versicolor CBS 583.65]|uniref:Uncharacterized protein n=1 Tax=Aspergillus versicolor CBS 583.65 TaxID=1036611 RepID=A0A1L9PVA4_ASPVE|nr:uncharacterized protein ASPVEDRAFT_855434 [Aspergillus versicolor CBS 583.65]OJJ05480.1 hypothetical protein ASPVEDRAFT_855434 [Aspergillus versicolor CBS 583.65]